MILRSPCPKCREPVLAGASRCVRCSYRLMSREIRDAKRLASLKLLLGLLVIGLSIYVVLH